MKGVDPVIVGELVAVKARHREDLQPWELGWGGGGAAAEQAGKTVLVPRDSMRPGVGGGADGGCEMSWGNRTSGGKIRRWRSN